MSEKKEWNTSIAGIFENESHVRGYKLSEMIKKLTFSQAIFLILKGELPTKQQEKMMDAILVSTIDNGLGPPSVTAARIVQSAGNALNASVAAGVLAIGDSHGGAIEGCAKLLQDGMTRKRPLTDVAKDIVNRYRLDRDRIPGYGHKIYNNDPRTSALFEVAENLGFKGKHAELALQIENDLEVSVGKKLCLNVDGAIAAILSDMGFDWKLGKGFFIIGRTVGIIAHAYEEMVREKPFRRIDESQISYDGQPPRDLPG